MSIQSSMGLQSMDTLLTFSKEGQGTNGDVFDMTQHEERKPLQQQYTSLCDLIVVSTTDHGRLLRAQDIEWCDIKDLKFKDKLLKLAAQAYLQPVVKESSTPTHFLTQCWISFTSKNKLLVFHLIEKVRRKADVCIKFFRAQAFNLMQRFKQPHAGLLQ